MKKNLKFIALMTASFTLSACGGGGSSTETNTSTNSNSNPIQQPVTPPVTPPITPPVTPPLDSGHLQTTVPVPTYAATTAELFTFNEINTFRKALGLGLVSQNTALDKAAVNHVNYISINKTPGHIESPVLQGFTGKSPTDRQVFAGFTGKVLGGEVISFAPMPQAIYSLINSVYHRDIIAAQYITNMGLSYGAGWGSPLAVEFGSITLQNNSPTFTTNYPLDGQVGLPLATFAEFPSPLPNTINSLSDFATKTSSPITFYSAFGTALTVKTFTVTAAGSITPLASSLITSSSDENKLVGSNTAHLIANAPFLANTKYTVKFEGSIDGIAISKAWSFTTGTSLDVGSGI